MASSKLMAASSSRNSNLKRKLSSCSSISGATDFLGSENSCNNAHDHLASLDGFLRNSYAESHQSSGKDRVRPVGEAGSYSGSLLRAEITVLDAAGAVSRSSKEEKEPRMMIRKTADEVWREILAGKKSGKQPKEEIMTLEDFLVKAEAEEEKKVGTILEFKEERLNEGIFAYKSSGVVEMGIGIGLDAGGLGRGTEKRSLSLLEPLDRAAQQRQRRMIKNRESASRSRERKQAYQVELESLAARLEEENERLLKEKDERTKKRLKQIMKNVIPVVEKQKPPRILRKLRSMRW